MNIRFVISAGLAGLTLLVGAGCSAAGPTPSPSSVPAATQIPTTSPNGPALVPSSTVLTSGAKGAYAYQLVGYTDGPQVCVALVDLTKGANNSRSCNTQPLVGVGDTLDAYTGPGGQRYYYGLTSTEATQIVLKAGGKELDKATTKLPADFGMAGRFFIIAAPANKAATVVALQAPGS